MKRRRSLDALSVSSSEVSNAPEVPSQHVVKSGGDDDVGDCAKDDQAGALPEICQKLRYM
jgi:hypothetical protein